MLGEPGPGMPSSLPVSPPWKPPTVLVAASVTLTVALADWLPSVAVIG
jgi:hypothetical protein